jgi:hypothetical protein
LDTTLRSDHVVKELLGLLDHKVGEHRYVLALSADHGVCPLPELSRADGQDAGRVSASRLRSGAEAHLTATYGGADSGSIRWIDGTANLWIYLNRRLLAERGLKSTAVEATLADWLKKQPGVLTAYTRSQLLAGVPLGDRIGQSIVKSFHTLRGGDVAVVLKPYYIPSAGLVTGTTHGSPHPYDTHVPLLLYGSCFRRGTYEVGVIPQLLVAALSAGIEIKPPALAKAPLPPSLIVHESGASLQPGSNLPVGQTQP